MKLKEVGNFEDLMLKFEVKIGRRTLGCPFGAFWWCSKTFFSF